MSSSHHDHGPDAEGSGESTAPARGSEPGRLRLHPAGRQLVAQQHRLPGRAQGVIAIDTTSTERRTRALPGRDRGRHDRSRCGRWSTPTTTATTRTATACSPDATIIGHQRCRDELLAFGPPPDGFSGRGRLGRPQIEAPFVTFDDRLDLRVDDLRVELHFIGPPAHTTNDVVAWIPERKVLFAGDLVFNGGTPFVLMGSVGGSLAALERLRALRRRGRGARPRRRLRPRRVRRRPALSASSCSDGGRGPGGRAAPLEAARRPTSARSPSSADPERIVGNLHRAYAELDGAQPGAPIDMRAAITDMVTYNGGPLRCLA